MKKIFIPLIIIAFLATGCGSTGKKNLPGKPAVQKPAPTTRTVDISNSTFQPATITINAGDTVAWTNRDSIPHSIKGQGFGSAPLAPNEAYQIPLTKAGTYDYSCGIHPNMQGKIIVQ